MLDSTAKGIGKHSGKGGGTMIQLCTYHDSEGYHTLWKFSDGYRLENHALGGATHAIPKDEALTILRRYGYRRQAYAPTPLEKCQRPSKMREVEPGVFSWSEA